MSEEAQKEEPRSPSDIAKDPAITWAALNDREKIERLRLVVKQLDRRLARQPQLEGIIAQLIDHQHGNDGRLLAPMRFGAAHSPDERDTPDSKAWF